MRHSSPKASEHFHLPQARQRARRAGLVCLLTWLLACASCTSLLHFPGHLEDRWTPLPNGGYRFSNQDLELEFRPDPKGVFHWRFKNKTRVMLTIDHQRLALRKSDDPRPFTIWGKPRREGMQIAPIIVRPEAFVSFSYPVLLRGPWFPFKPSAENAPWLEFQAQWGRQRFDYKLVFPPAP